MAIGGATILVSSVLTWLVVDDSIARAATATVGGRAGFNFGDRALTCWPGCLVLSLVIIYRYVPRRTVRWRWAFLGSLAVGVALQLMNYGFAMFMAHVAPSQFVQGITALVILFWLFLAARLLAWGAALSAYAQSVYDRDGPAPGFVQMRCAFRLAARHSGCARLTILIK